LRAEVGAGDTQTDSKGSETITEDEKEKQAEPDGLGGVGMPLAHSTSQSSSSHDPLNNEAEPQLVTAIIDDSSSTNEIHSKSSNGMDIGAGIVHSNVAPHTGTQDLASIEWSYLDPQGQVQGESILRPTARLPV
jgi:hypothetical protein